MKQDGLDEEKKRVVKGEKVRMVENDHKAIIEQRSSFFSTSFSFSLNQRLLLVSLEIFPEAERCQVTRQIN